MSLDPSWAPQNETATTIFLERTFIGGDVICGLGLGIQLCMFAYCANYLWQTRHTRKQSLFMLAYISVVFMVEIMFVGVQARTIQICYIDNRNYPGGPWQFFLDTQNLPVNVLFYATLFVITFLCDCLVLWRCWVIWTASGHRTAYAVTAFPALMILASFVMGTLWTLQSSQPGLSFYSALPMAYGTAYYAISLGVNVVMTILITIRLLQYRRTVMGALPAEYAKHYLSIATVLVESAALYSVFAILFLVTYAVNNPINQIMLAIAQATQQISIYLIIYRLADGSAWQRNTLNRHTMTTMKFEERERRSQPKTRTDTTLTTSDLLDTFSAAPNPSASTVFDKKTRDGLPATPNLAIDEKRGASMV